MLQIDMPRRRDAFTLERSRRLGAQPKQQAASAQRSATVIDATAPEELRNYILQRYATGALYATDVARLAHLLVRCNVPGFENLALDPRLPSFAANASRKVSSSADLVALQDRTYKAEIPYADEKGNRVMVQVPFNLIHEILAQEFEENPYAARETRDSLATDNWLNNEVKQSCAASGEECIPYGHFVDGAAYKGKGTANTGTVLTYTINLLGSRTRRALVAVDKERLCGEACKCPCRGRCTLTAVERIISWSARCAAEGRFPQHRHDGSAFRSDHRQELSGRRLVSERASPQGARFALLEFRADWEQYSFGLGTPWPIQNRFCFLCTCDRDSAWDFDRCDDWHLRTHTEYEAEVGSCLQEIEVTRADASRILQALKFDYRRDGQHGRVLSHQLSVHDRRSRCRVVLRKDSRLEVGGAVWDIWLDETGLGDTNRMVFWKDTPNVPFYYMPPIMTVPGVRFEHLTLDILHVLDLGVCAILVGTIVYRILQDGSLFKNPRTLPGMLRAMPALNLKLRLWQLGGARSRRAQGITEQPSEARRLTLKMLTVSSATGSRPKLKYKGAECRGLLPFALSLLRPRVVRSTQAKNLHGKELMAAAKALLQAYRAMDAAGQNLVPEDLHRPLVRCGVKSRAAGVNMVPKYHLLPHLGTRVRFSGNPRLHSCYEDESFYLDMVRIAQSTSIKEFSGRLLAKLELSLRMERLLR